MEFVFNELSLHGQFGSMQDAATALRKLLQCRVRIQQEGTTLRIVRDPQRLFTRLLTDSNTVRDVIHSLLDKNLRSLAISWLAKDGPFWDDSRMHSSEDWVEHNGEIITDSGVAEAAVAVALGHERTVLSMSPSLWERTPLEVAWIRSESDQSSVMLANVWDDVGLALQLEQRRRLLVSWGDLFEWAKRSCPNLTLATYAIAPLERQPFVPGAARRFQELLTTLDKLKSSFTEDGHLNREGMHLFQNHFVGEKAWFTDSSDTEKVEFHNEMTFPHPEVAQEHIFCPWHGKVKIQQMRVHFSYPITRTQPLYVVYLGPKITKR